MKSNFGHLSIGPLVFLVFTVAFSFVSDGVDAEIYIPNIAVPPTKLQNVATQPRKEPIVGDSLNPRTGGTAPSPSSPVLTKEQQNAATQPPQKGPIVSDILDRRTEKPPPSPASVVPTKEQQNATASPQKGTNIGDVTNPPTEKTPTAPSRSQAGLFPLSIIHVNDFHARYVHLIIHTHTYIWLHKSRATLVFTAMS